MIKKILLNAFMTYLALGFGIVTMATVMSRMTGAHDPFPEFAPFWVKGSLFLVFFICYLYRLSQSTR